MIVVIAVATILLQFHRLIIIYHPFLDLTCLWIPTSGRRTLVASKPMLRTNFLASSLRSAHCGDVWSILPVPVSSRWARKSSLRASITVLYQEVGLASRQRFRESLMRSPKLWYCCRSVHVCRVRIVLYRRYQWCSNRKKTICMPSFWLSYKLWYQSTCLTNILIFAYNMDPYTKLYAYSDVQSPDRSDQLVVNNREHGHLEEGGEENPAVVEPLRHQ